YQPLIDVLSCCFWRTPKAEVENQITAGKVTYLTELLTFSQIERDLYLKEASTCNSSILEKLRTYSLDTKLSDLSSSVQSCLINLALKLRQICCHPEIINTSRT